MSVPSAGRPVTRIALGAALAVMSGCAEPAPRSPRPSPASRAMTAVRPGRAATAPPSRAMAGTNARAGAGTKARVAAGGPGVTGGPTVSLIAAGDVTFGRQVDRTLQPFGYKRPFRGVEPLLRGHDIVMANLETPITARRLRWMPGFLVFRARPVAARLLRLAGFTLMVTANNHARDQGPRGLRETLTHLQKAGLAWVGTGRTVRRAWQPYLLSRSGIRVGVIAATTIRNYNMRPHGARLAYIPSRQMHRLAWVVQSLRRKVDIVVVSLHYGAEYKNETTWRERQWVRSLMKAGCDLFVGHHPHVLRGIQRRGRKVAFYSLGNFMFDLGWPETLESGLARVVFEKHKGRARIRSAELIPVRIGGDYTPRRAKGRQAAAILSNVISYSRRWKGSRYLRRVGDRLRVDLSAP